MRVLLSGHIDLNVIDGSALFVANIAALASSHPGVEVDLLSCKPVTNSVAVEELQGLAGVKVVDPYDRETPASLGIEPVSAGSPAFAGNPASAEEAKHGVSASTCAQILAEYVERAEQGESPYDVVFVRDTLMAWEAVTQWGLDPTNLAVYVTGFTHYDRRPDAALCRAVRVLERLGAYLVFQTPEMLQWVQFNVFGRRVPRSFVLMPCLPLLFSDLSAAEKRVKENSTATKHGSSAANRRPSLRLTYVGKFFPEWAPIEQIAAFRESRLANPRAAFTVAGDHFRSSDTDPLFVEKVRYLLESTPGLEWVGGVPRWRARQIMLDSDVGFGLRQKGLETSLEFSSKVLEYGACGLAVVLNRTDMHEQLLGPDYPLFADNITSAGEALQLASQDTEVLALARQRCVSLARSRSFQTGALEFSHLLTLVAGAPSLRTAVREGGIYRDPNNLDVVVGLDLLDEKARQLALGPSCPPLNVASGDPVLTVSGLLRLGERAPENEKEHRSSNRRAVVEMEAWQLSRLLTVGALAKQGSHEPDAKPSSRNGQRQSDSVDKGQHEKVEALEKQLSVRNRELQGARARLRTSDERLQALRMSKLGSLQTKWWRLRKWGQTKVHGVGKNSS